MMLYPHFLYALYPLAASHDLRHNALPLVPWLVSFIGEFLATALRMPSSVSLQVPAFAVPTAWNVLPLALLVAGFL